jgi:HEAT repeat protein
VLQHLPGERTADALASLLDDPSLELRGQAAISLSRLGDARGASVLVELVERASYDAVHRERPEKFASEGLIQTSRFKALEALARLRRPQDRALLERVARDDADPLVREAAMRALEGL